MARGRRAGKPGRGRVPRPGRADGRQPHPHPGGFRPSRRSLRRAAETGRRVRHPGRQGDGEPLRVPVGPVPLRAVARSRGRERARRVLLAESRRPQLLEEPGHARAGRERRHEKPVRAERRGRARMDAAVLHARRSALRQDHRRRAQRGILSVELLAVLADDVRL